ncbi:protein phosphatase 1A [Neocloeon triangulifer]|uniref:protein phosphatase 1A n=1 Tax=Neocloeon triangulifer TaxID=2078957 RepID=UPI00286F8A3C|nr:protein phosphatase 1A [Neocloeon triangulifer]XP_059476855.1 protein phosphatase 1A [Neocloeon triangulifer]XP_059476862.1 protein phosphatase 1A [Neocloeon triangulifer]XP_059476869.1 protein phosphatase 1A [Neocloeon triangulifer]
MGAFLDKPKTEKYNERGSGNGLRYGLASMQGWRVEMEDAHCAVTALPGELKDWSFYAVFDGHAGARVSAHCATNLLDCIMQTDEFKKSIGDSDPTSATDAIKQGIRSGFLNLDENMRELPEVATGEDKSGSTAVCALITPQTVFIANCGDSRAIISRDGYPSFSTRDHKPIMPDEKERIQRAGGSVMIQRVNGSLAVSRALGDYEYKNVEGKGPCEQLVSPEPEIFVEQRDDARDEFMVLACDGVWDVMSNEDLCSFVSSRMVLTDDLELIANQVIDTCLYKGSRDNMSVVVVAFPAAPKVSSKAIAQEEELEQQLEKHITELVEQNDSITFQQLIRSMHELEIPNIPPGGGLSAKRNFVEEVFKKLCPDRADSMAMGDDAGAMNFLRTMMPRAAELTAAAIASEISMEDEEPAENQ